MAATRGRARASIVASAAALGLGFLAGCPTVDLGDTPSEIGVCNPAGGLQYFQDQIWPNYVVRNNAANSCATVSCHVGGGNALDYPAQIDYAVAYRRTQIHLNCGMPGASPFLTKPLAGIDPHGGKDIFLDQSDPAVQIFFAWFQ